MHQRVDLELCVVEGVRGRLLHLPVDDLPHPRVQAHLGGTERNWGWGTPKDKPPASAPIPAPALLGNWVSMWHQMWGNHSVLHPRGYWHWSPGGWGGLQGEVRSSLCPLCVPRLGTGRWVGVVPPWVPPLRGCCRPGCSTSSARWCPREVSAPQHNPARGPTAGSVPGVLGGWISPSHCRYPAKLLPRLSQGSGGSWNRALSLRTLLSKALPPTSLGERMEM